MAYLRFIGDYDLIIPRLALPDVNGLGYRARRLVPANRMPTLLHRVCAIITSRVKGLELGKADDHW